MLGGLNGEWNMAKRRNLKKEKAQRNLAYARKFRKRSNSGRMNRSRRPSASAEAETNEEELTTESSEGATA
jgi:hypothetical protein